VTQTKAAAEPALPGCQQRPLEGVTREARRGGGSKLGVVKDFLHVVEIFKDVQ